MAVNIFYSIKTIFTFFQPWSGDTVVTAITKMADFGANIFKMEMNQLISTTGKR